MSVGIFQLCLDRARVFKLQVATHTQMPGRFWSRNACKQIENNLLKTWIDRSIPQLLSAIWSTFLGNFVVENSSTHFIPSEDQKQSSSAQKSISKLFLTCQ